MSEAIVNPTSTRLVLSQICPSRVFPASFTVIRRANSIAHLTRGGERLPQNLRACCLIPNIKKEDQRHAIEKILVREYPRKSDRGFFSNLLTDFVGNCIADTHLTLPPYPGEKPLFENIDDKANHGSDESDAQHTQDNHFG